MFKTKLVSGERLVGTFVKTPSIHVVEIIGELGFDYVVLDEEHAPFDRAAIDHALLAAKAARIPALVRVASTASILSVLDLGATGVLVPHVTRAEEARSIAAACRYATGSRGFSNSPRAGRYGGRDLLDHVEHNDKKTTVIAQIEDPEALGNITEIVSTDGIDALFIGRADLTVAMKAASIEAEDIKAACRHICAAARSAGKPVMVFVTSKADAAAMAALGATAFIMSSDQGLLRRGASAALAEARTAE